MTEKISNYLQFNYPGVWEFLVRADQAARNHNRLVYAISFVEVVLAVFLLAGHYQPQLMDGFLTTSPKTYSLSKFDPKVRYVLNQGDFVRGIDEPGSKIKIIFTSPKIIVKAYPNPKGSWTYQIPRDFVAKRYRMAVIVFDKDGKHPQVRYYRIRVQTNNKVLGNPVYQKLTGFMK